MDEFNAQPLIDLAISTAKFKLENFGELLAFGIVAGPLFGAGANPEDNRLLFVDMDDPESDGLSPTEVRLNVQSRVTTLIKNGFRFWALVMDATLRPLEDGSGVDAIYMTYAVENNSKHASIGIEYHKENGIYQYKEQVVYTQRTNNQ